MGKLVAELQEVRPSMATVAGMEYQQTLPRSMRFTESEKKMLLDPSLLHGRNLSPDENTRLYRVEQKYRRAVDYGPSRTPLLNALGELMKTQYLDGRGRRNYFIEEPIAFGADLLSLAIIASKGLQITSKAARLRYITNATSGLKINKVMGAGAKVNKWMEKTGQIYQSKRYIRYPVRALHTAFEPELIGESALKFIGQKGTAGYGAIRGWIGGPNASLNMRKIRIMESIGVDTGIDMVVDDVEWGDFPDDLPLLPIDALKERGTTSIPFELGIMRTDPQGVGEVFKKQAEASAFRILEVLARYEVDI